MSNVAGVVATFGEGPADEDIDQVRSISSPAPRSRERWLRLALPLTTIAVLLGAWQLSSIWVNPIEFSSPGAIIGDYRYLIESGTLGHALSTTMTEWAISLGIGLSGGLALGVFMGRYRWFERLMSPFVNFVNATPRVVLIPLLIVWIGISGEGRVIFTVLSNIFVVLFNTMAGVKNVRALYVDVGRSLGLSDRAVTWRIRVPGAIPYILAGTRFAASASLVGLIVAQMEFSNVGVGYLILQYGTNLETDKMLAVLAVTSVIGLILVFVFKFIEKTFFNWVRETSSFGRR